MLKKSVYCLLFILLFPTAIAIPNSDNVREMLDYLHDFELEYNKNIDKVPGWAKSLLGSERINATLVLNDNTPVNIGIIFNNGEIVEMRRGRLRKPTINLYASEDDIVGILSESGYKSRLDKLKNYYDNDMIRYEYVAFRTKIKFGSVGMAYGLFQKFR